MKILPEWLVHRMDAPEGFERQAKPLHHPEHPGNNTVGWWDARLQPLDRLKAVALRAGFEGASFQKLRVSVATHMEAALRFGTAKSKGSCAIRTSAPPGPLHAHDRENMKKAMENFGY